MNLKEVRNIISQYSLDHIRFGKGNLILKTFTGSGKTTTVLKTIYESEDGFTWMYFAPYHKVIEENIELSKVIDFHGFIHLESRKKLCLSKEYRALADRGINITPFCENFCILRDTRCPYYERLRKVREMPTCLAGVHSHIPTLMQSLFYEKWENRCLYNYYDVIVIDEFPLNTIYNQISLNRRDINYARDILELVDIDNNESHVLRLMLDELSLATNNININYQKIFTIINSYKGLNFDEFKDNYDARLLDLITKKRIKNPPKEDVFYFLIEIYRLKPSIEELYWLIHKTENDQWNKGRIYLTISNISSFKNLPIKVIALDGTADINTWKSVLGEDCNSISFDIEYKNTYQLIGARNPISTIVNKGELTSSGKKLQFLLNEICKYKKQKTITCASKRVQSLIKKGLKKNKYEFATFYNLRSRNSYYEDCDTLVVFHEPNIPPFQVEILKNVIGWDEDLIRKIHREDESKQGIGRLRQNIPVTPRGRKRGAREIFLFTSFGYNRIVPEARFMLYGDMLGYIRGEPKRLFYENLKDLIKNNSPITKTKLAKSIGLTPTQTKRLLNVLEENSIIKIEWGEVHWLRDISAEEEEKFLIRIGVNK